MPKQKKRLTKEEKLIKDRIRKKKKYEEIKDNPELYQIQKEKERKRYLLKKEKKKILSIKEMTPRDQREQRKRWRRNTKAYLKKREERNILEKILVDNSPPDSDNDVLNSNEYIPEQDPLARTPEKVNFMRIPTRTTEKEDITSSTAAPGSRQVPVVIRKLRYRHGKVVKTLQEEIQKLRKEKKALQRIVCSKQNPIKAVDDSIEKKVNEMISDIRPEKVKEIKKQLMFTETMTRDMTVGYKTLKKKEKRNFADTILKNREKLKKYKLMAKVPFRIRKEMPQETPNEIKAKIQSFFQEDNNSRVASGKNEYIKRKGITKQKRYICDNLKNLHDKFIKEHSNVSYSTFCKYRPFWVVFPNNERDTCLCKLHCNLDLLLKALNREKIITEVSGSQMIKSLCCDYSKDECLDRRCEQCKNRVLNFMEFTNDRKVAYYQWLSEKQTYLDRSGKEKVKNVWTKKRIEDYPKNLITKLDEIERKYFEHCRAITMQYFAIKNLKQSLQNDAVIMHIDFSENYAFKYHEEIQSFHFGGSRGQASLHTGVLYYKDKETGSLCNKSFCTMSKNLNHDANSVWAHIEPVLKMAQDLVPQLKTIHFLSDSPSSQYRNRYIFYMVTKLKDKVKDLERVTWNYHEAGHGKGAPDGVGAVIKRTADNFIKFGEDIGTFETFTEVITANVQSVHVEVVNEGEVSKKRFPNNLPGFRGTIKVHQVLWCLSLPDNIALRNLSCFSCQDNYIPCSHGRHLGNVCYGGLSKESVITQATSENIYQNKKSDGRYCNDVDIHIDSPTLANNVHDINSVEDEIIFDDILMPVDNMMKMPINKVQILSDKFLKWPNLSFYETPTRTFNPFEQKDFEEFIQASSIHINENSNKENFSTITEQDQDVIRVSTIKEQNNEENENNINPYNENPTLNTGPDPFKPEIHEHDWVVVPYQIKSKIYYYIGQVKEISNGCNKILFLKKVGGKSLKFYWPDQTDEDALPDSRLIKLGEPICTRRGQYIFDKLPGDYTYK